MKNLEYIRKYELFVSAEIGSRPIDKPENQRKFLQDLYFDYQANLNALQETKGQISIKAFDQVYAQMLQKLNSLGKKTPWDLPQDFYSQLENFYNSFIKRYCPEFYAKIEEISSWEYKEHEQFHDSGFIEFFHGYGLSVWGYRREHDFSKYPKIVKIAYDIYVEKKRQFEQREKQREAEQQRIHRERMQNDPQYRAKHLFNGYGSFFGGFYENIFNNMLFDMLMQGMARPTDAFCTLGLDDQATVEQVKTAFRQLSMIHHPDKGGSQEKFIEITEARDKCLAYLKQKQ